MIVFEIIYDLENIKFSLTFIFYNNSILIKNNILRVYLFRSIHIGTLFADKIKHLALSNLVDFKEPLHLKTVRSIVMASTFLLCSIRHYPA